MQFIDFLNSQSLSMNEVATRWGVSASTVSRPAKGQGWPSPMVIVRAHELSGGTVGLADWIETCREYLEERGILPAHNVGQDHHGEGIDRKSVV